MVATRSLHALACRGVTSPYFSAFQDPFTCQDPFLVADRRIVSLNEGLRLQSRGSHMCAFPRGQEKKEMDQAARRARLQRPRIGTIQNVRGASLDRAVAHDRARRPWHHLRSAPRASRTARRSNWTRGRGARARRSHRREGMPPHAARFVSLPWETRGSRQVARFGRTVSPESAPRSAHWGWTCSHTIVS